MKPKRETSPEQDREETIAYLEFERPVWMQLRDRAERAGNNDGFLNRERENSMKRINHLLEDLFAQNVMIEAFND